MMSRLPAYGLLVMPVYLVLSSAPPTTAQPIAMSAQQFAALSAQEQRALLVCVFEQRLEHVRNLHLELEISMSFFRSEQGEPVGQKLEQNPEQVFRHWRLGDSYRVDREASMTVGGDVHARASLGFDAREGIGRRMSRSRDRPESYGAIDSEHASLLQQDRYSPWLDGEYLEYEDDYLFRYLLNRQGEFLIEAPVEEGLVRLSVSYPRRRVETPGRRTLLLDPEKAFLPIRIDSRYEETQKDGTLDYFFETWIVHESRLVGDVWMPIRVTLMIDSVSVPGIVAVCDMTVLRIEHGIVHPADLEIVFPERTRVTDMIQGITYLVDSQGNPMDIEPILAAIDPADIPAPPSGTGEEGEPVIRGPWLNVRYLAVGIAGLVVALVVVWGARRTSGGGS